MAVCEACGELNKDGLKYCAYCGKSLPKTEAKKPEENKTDTAVRCPACGEKNLASFKNCKYCGELLDQVEYDIRNKSRSRKVSLDEQLDAKGWAIFIALVVVLYVLCYTILAPVYIIVATVIGWKWTGINVAFFVDFEVAIGMLLGRIIASFFIGIIISPFVIAKKIMKLI